MSKKTDKAYEAILRAFESPDDQFDSFGDDDKVDLDKNFEDNQGGSEDKSWSANDEQAQPDTITELFSEEDVDLPVNADNDEDLENEWDVNTAEKEREEFETGITAQKFDESYREEEVKNINGLFSETKDYETVFDNTWKAGLSSNDRADDVSGTTDDDKNQEIKVGQNQEPNKELGSRRVQLEKSGEGYIMDNTNYYAALEGDGIIAGQADVVDDTHEDAIPTSQYGKVVKEKTTWTTEAGTEWQCPECSQTYSQIDDMAAVNHLYNTHGYSEQDAKSVGGYLSEGFAREDLLGIPEEKAINTSDNYSVTPEKLEDEAETTLGGVVQPATGTTESIVSTPCPNCGQSKLWQGDEFNTGSDVYTCQNCGGVFDNKELKLGFYGLGETDAENTDGTYDGITILEDDPLNDQKVEIQNTLAQDEIGGYDPQQGFADDDSGQSIGESRRVKKNEKLEHNDLQDLGTEDALGDVDKFDTDIVDTANDIDQYRGDSQRELKFNPLNDWKSKTPATGEADDDYDFFKEMDKEDAQIKKEEDDDKDLEKQWSESDSAIPQIRPSGVEYNPDENDILAGRTIEQYLAENNMTREEGEAVARYADMDLRELIQVGNFGEAAYHMEQDNPANWGESKGEWSSIDKSQDQLDKEMDERLERRGFKESKAKEIDYEHDTDEADEGIYKAWREFYSQLGVEQGQRAWIDFAGLRGIPEWRAEEYWDGQGIDVQVWTESLATEVDILVDDSGEDVDYITTMGTSGNMSFTDGNQTLVQTDDPWGLGQDLEDEGYVYNNSLGMWDINMGDLTDRDGNIISPDSTRNAQSINDTWQYGQGEVDKEIDKLSTELEHTDQSVIDQKNYYKSPQEWREDLADMRREAGADAGTSAGDEHDMAINPEAEAVEDDPDYLSDPDVTGFVDNPYTPNLTGKNKVQHSQFTYDGFNKAEDELNRERGDIDTNNEALEDNTGLNTSSNQAGNVFTCEDCGFKTHNRDEYDNHNKEHGNVPATTETPKGFSEESIAHSNNDYEILSRFS